MKMLSKLFTVVFLVTVFASCGGTTNYFTMTNDEKLGSQEMVDGQPVWVAYPPLDDQNWLYGVASVDGSSGFKSQVQRQAISQGRTVLAQNMQSKVQSVQRSFEESITEGLLQNSRSTFEEVDKQVSEATLRNSQPIIQKCADLKEPETGNANVNMTCYVVMRVPTGNMRETFEQAMSRDQELYVEFKKSRAFEEFNKEFPPAGSEN